MGWDQRDPLGSGVGMCERTPRGQDSFGCPNSLGWGTCIVRHPHHPNTLSSLRDICQEIVHTSSPVSAKRTGKTLRARERKGGREVKTHPQRSWS